ncbi:hypothetical protein ABES03_08395 [Neobacillus rhizosphaerae]|uniref:hypothetical protein n=1 Tax=Neobacillus rhizosphaerae TaxID=2880965 RepID=UPI003D27E373
MKKNLKVVHDGMKAEMLFAELVLGSGNIPSFEGEVLAINPSKEEFATYNENFEMAVRDGVVPDVLEGVVYFDHGANRAFIVSEEYVEYSVLN